MGRMATESLQEIYKEYCQEGEGTLLQKAFVASCRKNSIENLLKGWAADTSAFNSALSPYELLQEWRALLTAQLLMSLQMKEKEERPFFLSYRLEKISSQAFWEEFQLLQAYKRFNQILAQESSAPLHCVQFKGGAAPFETRGYWSWGAVPHALFHAELGILWALLGHQLEDSSLKKRAVELVRWQINTLDASYLPLCGVFCMEGQSSFAELLAANAALFHAAAVLLDMPEGEYICQKQLQHLREMGKRGAIAIPVHFAAISHWLDNCFAAPEVHFFPLNSTICDPSTMMMGCREGNQSIVCTMAGGQTGLGTYKYGDVGIASYGPQFQPLGDCRAYGIERGCFLEKSPFGAVSLDSQSQGFKLSGRARMTPPPASHKTQSLFRRSSSPCGWVDLVQEYHQGTLTVDVSFYTLGSTPIAFSFFMQGKRCIVDREIKLKPRSLDRYEGNIHSVSIEGGGDSLNITSLSGRGEMQVIPLAGEDHFWGADFLVSYLVDPLVQMHTWHVIPKCAGTGKK